MIFSKRNLSTRDRSARSEKRAAEILGGRRQPASGALPVASMKADVKTGKFLVEDKVTEKDSYRLTLKDWKKLQQQAFTAHREPVFRITTKAGTFYVVDELTFVNMKSAYDLV